MEDVLDEELAGLGDLQADLGGRGPWGSVGAQVRRRVNNTPPHGIRRLFSQHQCRHKLGSSGGAAASHQSGLCGDAAGVEEDRVTNLCGAAGAVTRRRLLAEGG